MSYPFPSPAEHRMPPSQHGDEHSDTSHLSSPQNPPLAKYVYSDRPTNGDRTHWQRYWAKRGLTWRWEPEISPTRQEDLAQWRSKIFDPIKHNFPFAGIELTRADIEWLLATHEDYQGPIGHHAAFKHEREGIDLRGAFIPSQTNLSQLPLTQVRCGLSFFEWIHATEGQRKGAGTLLKGVNLSKAKLVRADLREAHLEEANLYQTDLRGGHLRRADLKGANLEEADLCDADLRDADLKEANLYKVNLKSADLRGASLREVHLNKAKLEGADLRKVDLREAHLEEADLSGADLREADLYKIKLRRADLRGINLEGTNLYKADLSEADLR